MRQLIILEQTTPIGWYVELSCIFWYSVPPGQEVPIPGFKSKFKGVTAQEATDLEDGKIVEEPFTDKYPKSFTTNEIKNALTKTYNDRKAHRDSLPNKGQYYGVSWDGASWST